MWTETAIILLCSEPLLFLCSDIFKGLIFAMSSLNCCDKRKHSAIYYPHVSRLWQIYISANLHRLKTAIPDCCHIMLLHSYSSKHAVTCIQTRPTLPISAVCPSACLPVCQLCLAAFSYWKSLKWQTSSPSTCLTVLCGNFGSPTLRMKDLKKKSRAQCILILIDIAWGALA